jgi:CBS-domain-containing membrane protein
LPEKNSLRENVRNNWKTYLWRALGGAIGIYAMLFLAEMGQFPIALVPFATSVVNVIGLPDAAPGQPRALIGGHLISTIIGLSIVAMHMSGTMHPPAGINPLIIVTSSLPWSFLFVPVLAGVFVLTALAYVWHGIENRYIDHQGKWPASWY